MLRRLLAAGRVGPPGESAVAHAIDAPLRPAGKWRVPGLG
jgi:hypothetical protein